MNARSLDDIAAAVVDAFPKLSAPEQRVALALYRLLAMGQPVTAEQISGPSNVAWAAVADMLAKWHGVQRGPDGAVTAFWGLTLSKTKHRFRINGRELQLGALGIRSFSHRCSTPWLKCNPPARRPACRSHLG